MFFEGRALPKEFRASGGYERYGDSTQDGAVKIFDAISPFKLLEKLFVTKPLAERQAQLELARIQAEAQQNSSMIRSENMEELLKYAAIGVGALVVVILVTKRRAPAKVGKYRRSKRRTRRAR